jgi:hypothetical protein
MFPDVLKGIVPGEEAADVTPPPPPAQVRRLSDSRQVAERIEDIRAELGLPATDVDDTLPVASEK